MTRTDQPTLKIKNKRIYLKLVGAQAYNMSHSTLFILKQMLCQSYAQSYRCWKIRDIGENVPHCRTSSPVTSLHELLHGTLTSGITLITKQPCSGPNGAVTTRGLPQSNRGAPSYPKDPAYPGTTPVYEVTTLAPPGLPPFRWTSNTLRQAQKHNEPTSLPISSTLRKQPR